MTYQEVLDYIKDRNKLGSVPGLYNIKELLKRLGNPEKKIPAIHIAGTNGKGSIMAFIEQCLIEAGFKAGRFISPAIFDFREQMQIEHQFISERQCADVMTDVIKKVNEMDKEGTFHPTSFEIETAAAFLWFYNQRCDIMLIECGMGGRLDATNVLDESAVNIMASVSRDHMKFLGKSIYEITNEKLGIVSENGMLFSYPVCLEARKAIEQFKNEHNIKVIYADESKLCNITTGPFGSRFKYGEVEYSINMGGKYQIDNAITAIELLKNLPFATQKWVSPIYISDENIIKGLYNTKWAGRFMVLNKSPLFIADGAHNEDAWMVLKDSLCDYFPGRKFIFLLGVLADKEVDKMINLLSPLIKHAVTITPFSPGRALSGEILAERLLEKKVEAEYSASVSGAVKRVYELAGRNEIIIACGSLSFIGDIIRENQKNNIGACNETN